MTKSELRSIYQKKRRELTKPEVGERSKQIAEIFFGDVDLSAVRYLHTFIPIEKNHEPDTWLIIDGIQNHHSEISIVLPRINNVTGRIENYLYTRREDLETNAWGIKEPRETLSIHAEQIDLVLIPLLSFDQTGHRVGYGKGFYDRFLRDCRKDCQRIGLSLFDAVDRITDVDSFDEPLHRCITPTRMITF